MKKFVIVVFGLLLFFVLVNHSPPVLVDANDTIIEENPGQFVNLVTVENPVEFRAAEVVIKGPGLEMSTLTTKLEEQNFANVINFLPIQLPSLNISLIGDPEDILTQNLCPRVLSLLLNAGNISYDKNPVYASAIELEKETYYLQNRFRPGVLSLFYNSFTA